jgi:hypothetical protein
MTTSGGAGNGEQRVLRFEKDGQVMRDVLGSSLGRLTLVEEVGYGA